MLYNVMHASYCQTKKLCCEIHTFNGCDKKNLFEEFPFRLNYSNASKSK